MDFRAGGCRFDFRPGQPGGESSFFVIPSANGKTLKSSQLRIINRSLRITTLVHKLCGAHRSRRVGDGVFPGVVI